jgi:hypothetical protein
MGFLQRHFRRQNIAARIEKHRQQRDQLVLELTELEERAAWDLLSDEMIEQHEGEVWQRQAAALRKAIDRLDIEILRLSLEEL